MLTMLMVVAEAVRAMQMVMRAAIALHRFPAEAQSPRNRALGTIQALQGRGRLGTSRRAWAGLGR